MLTPEFQKQICNAIPRKREVSTLPGHTPAGVLVPIIQRDTGPNLILTKRAMTLAKHKGQIAFPGGIQEPHDRTLVDTALRETFEEIGIHPKYVEVVGILNDCPTITRYMITPVVGFVASPATLTVCPSEVDQILEVPFDYLCNPEHYTVKQRAYKGVVFNDHQFHLPNNAIVWGATGRIIADFLVSGQFISKK